MMEAQKKKRRKRKVAPESAPTPNFDSQDEQVITEEDVAIMKDVASFEFKPEDAISMGTSGIHKIRS